MKVGVVTELNAVLNGCEALFEWSYIDLTR